MRLRCEGKLPLDADQDLLHLGLARNRKWASQRLTAAHRPKNSLVRLAQRITAAASHLASLIDIDRADAVVPVRRVRHLRRVEPDLHVGLAAGAHRKDNELACIGRLMHPPFPLRTRSVGGCSHRQTEPASVESEVKSHPCVMWSNICLRRLHVQEGVGDAKVRIQITRYDCRGILLSHLTEPPGPLPPQAKDSFRCFGAVHGS